MSNFTDMQLLKNEYFILRHGESEANVAQLITSDPTQCISMYGLTAKGGEQVTKSVEQSKLEGLLNNETIIYSSDFKRTAESAELAKEVLNTKDVHLAPALRERSFGEYDGKSTTAYITIWHQDEQDKLEQQKNKVESAPEILHRLMELIKEVEAEYENRQILLVSHGDPLQVLQATFADLKPGQYQSLKYIELGELRKLTPKLH